MSSRFFTEYGSNPIIVYDPGGDNNSSVREGCCVYVNGVYFYYYGRHLTEPDPRRIDLATSTDGMNFTKYPGNPVIPADGGKSIPRVLYHDGYFWLYDSSNNLWKSTDGYNFTHIASNVIVAGGPGEWDEAGLSASSIIYRDDLSEFWLYYRSYDIYDGNKWKVGLATSPDGINFSKYGGNPIVSPSQDWEQVGVIGWSVFYYDSKWHAYYRGRPSAGTARIGYAYSNDGINWTKSANNPIVIESGAGSGEWDEKYILSPCFIFKENDTSQPGFLYLTGVNSVGHNQIGLYIQNRVGSFGQATTSTGCLKDTHITEHNPTTNYGSEEYLRLNSSYKYRSIAELTLPATAPGYTLIAASLALRYILTGETPEDRIVWAYKLTRTNWVELEATWNIYKTGSSWTAPGGDYVTVGPSGASRKVPDFYCWMYWDVYNIVKDALDCSNPAEFLLKFASESDPFESMYFCSLQHASVSYRPVLWLTYVAIPEVITLAAMNIRANSTTLMGYLSDWADIDEIGFDYGKVSGVYTDEVTDATGDFEAGFYALDISSLDPSTRYYYRAKIHSTSLGWFYGDEESFDTTADMPELYTDVPVTASTSSITPAGNITSTGGDANCDKRGFVYGLSSHADPGNVAPAASGYDSYEEEGGAFGTGAFSLLIGSLIASRVYYVRAYAHNSYGYRYGGEIPVLTSYNVNILYTTADASLGIRFDSSPGGSYPKPPYGGSIPHYRLVRSEDTELVTGDTVFGYLKGNFVYEHLYYGSGYYTDLYTLSNSFRRTEGIKKVKWEARIGNNNYPYGHYKRLLKTHGSNYFGSETGTPTDPRVKCEVLYTNLNTGAAWTLSELDDLSAGISLGEGGGWGTPACDMLRVYALWANAAVSTDNALPIGANVRLNGTVLEDEAEPCEVYFEWGPTAAYGNSTAKQSKVIGESFNADVTPITEIIHYRAVIETECGETFYGDDKVFSSSRGGNLLHRLISDGFV